MKNLVVLGVAGALVLSPLGVAAGGLVAKAGTLGVGVELLFAAHDKVNIGVGVNQFSDDKDINEAGVDYAAELDWQSALLLAHFYPRGQHFRISAGISYNQNEITVTAKPDGDVIRIGNTPYDVTDFDLSASGKIDFGGVAPYLGIGWGNSPKEGGFAINVDLGVSFQASPDVMLNVECELAGTDCASVYPQLQDDVAQEEIELRDDILEDYDMYPVFALGIGFSF